MQQLDAAILRARMDTSAHVTMLTGEGDKFFCARGHSNVARCRAQLQVLFRLHANETLNRLENTPKLVIAAINGHCVGGGLEFDGSGYSSE